MRLISWLRPVLFAGLVVSLAACSYIGNLFPDKQKQYRYSSELPDLEVPPDLSSPLSDGKDADSSSRGKHRPEEGEKTAADNETTESAGKAEPASAESSGKAKAKKRKAVKHDSSSVTLAESTDNAALIEMEQPFAESWNDVSRALGRLKVEISDQNRSDGVFYVYYGGERPKKPEDKSFWEDITSVFRGEKDQAREFQVKLEDKEGFTFIKILDQEGQAVSEGPGLDLLKRLHKKLLSLDQPESEGKEAEQAGEGEKK